MRQKGKLVLLGVGLLLIVTAVLLFIPRQDDLAYLAEVGEQYDVQILRDTWGVPHIFGQTDADVAYGLAYAHSQDDFLTIQQSLAAARGQLAQHYGPDAAPNDYMVQLLRIWDYIESQYEIDLTPETRLILQGYADGLNHYAALHEDEALPGLFPVRGQDVAAGFVHKTPLFFGLDGVLGELFAETRQREVSNKQSTAALPSTLSQPSPLVSSQLPYGSNTFAVSPERSANGETFLAVNSHQPWEGPVAWYEAHLHSETGWDTVGGVFPGAPIILHGHNRHLGWAFTVNSPDLIDVFVLDINPEDPNQYRFDGEWRELEVGQAPIRVKLLGNFSWTVREEVLWSVYGPTVRQEHGTYAIRYAGLGEQVGIVEQWYDLNRATSLEAWQAVMRRGLIPMFNVGYADQEGNIYYLYNGRIPLRSEGYDWTLYVPGDTSDTLWVDYLPFEQLPQVLNPASGFIQNSNSSPFQTTLGPDNPNPDDFSVTLGIETRMSNRAIRALDLLGNDESITETDFATYKFDMRFAASSDVARLVEIIVNSEWPTEDEAMQTAVSILNQWDLNTNPDSHGATLAVLTLHFLNEAEAVDLNVSKLIDNELPEAHVRDSFEQAVNLLRRQFGQVDVPWQQVNRLQRGDLNLGLGGAPDVLHAVYGILQEDGRFHGTAGDAYMMLVTWEASGQVKSRSIHQYGSATLREDSPHYADQAPLFIQRELKPVWLNEADIRANLEQSYRPGEE